MFASLRKLFSRPEAASELLSQTAHDQAAAHQAEGAASLATGDLAAATHSFEAALALAPGDSRTLVPLGYALWRQGRVEEAIARLEAAVAVDGSFVDARYLLAVTLQARDRLPEAIAQFEAIIAMDPGVADVYQPLVDAHLAVGNMDAAKTIAERGVECYRRALEDDPGNADLLNNCSALLRELKRSGEALAALDQALLIRPQFAEALNNRGLVLFDLDRFEEAVAAYDRALQINDRSADVHVHRGHALRELVRHEEALASYQRAQAIAGREDTFFNESLTRLVLGDFRQGFEKYEWRWQTTGRTHPKSQFAIPLWLGKESLVGKTIFLYAEQGLGDTIQLCRYAKCVAELGATVVLGIQRPLVPILAGLAGVDRVVALGPDEPVPSANYHCPLLSLPLALGTSLQTIPRPGPYVRPSGPAYAARLQNWQAKLGVQRRLKVGVVWSGNVEHKNDRHRSIPLVDFVRVIGGNARFIALQNEVRPADAPVLRDHPEIESFGADLVDFGETAALVAQLDLVISVDTSVAHLAAAMGKPVWLLVPFNPDWRWLLTRDDSPWYETVRIFRQTVFADWNTVLDRVAGELGSPARLQKNPSTGR